MHLSRISSGRLCVAAACAALALSGCGGDDDEGGGDQPAASAPTTTQGAPSAGGAGGEDAVKQTIIDWTFEGKCDLMTDKFLEEQAFVGDNRAERCKYFEDSFQKPQYSEDDVKFRKVEVKGNKATATVGSDISNVEADYTLVQQDGKWVIDEVSL